jgi:hypothetical protein
MSLDVDDCGVNGNRRTYVKWQVFKEECEMYTEPSLEVDQNTATIAGSAICAIVTCYVSQNINWQSGTLRTSYIAGGHRHSLLSPVITLAQAFSC